MKTNTLFLLSFFVLFSSFSVFSQDDDEEIPFIAEGKKIGIDVYYGTPMFFQWLVGQAVTSGLNDTYINRNVKNGGPFGVRLEYLVGDDFGIGLDIGFNSVTASATRIETIYDPNSGNSTETRYVDEFKSQKLGAIITFNVKLYQSNKYEASGVVGIGYGQRKLSFNSTDPNYNSGAYAFGDALVDAPVYPVSFRVGFINRYFFTPNFGINLGIGIGQGGLINGGLSFRL